MCNLAVYQSKKYQHMKINLLILTLFSATIMTAQKINYPKTNQIEHIDTYFGAKINDPYHWLEDDKSPETESWVKSQNEVTNNYLSKIPFREELKNRLTKLWNYEKISAPTKEGNYTYFYKNNGLQNQSVMYRKDNKGNEIVFLDPNTFSKDGTTSLDNVSFSKDGSLLAYSISEAGSDWRKVIFMKAASMEKIADILVDVKFSGLAWKGNEGVYYSVTKNQKEVNFRPKPMNINCIFIN
jgi:prolyl oligopeptidase